MYSPTTTSDTSTPATVELDSWVSIEDLADEVGLSEATIKSWTRKRCGYPRLRVARPARGVWRFRRSWVDAFLDACAPEDAQDLHPEPAPAGARPAAAALDGIRDVVDRPQRPARRRRPAAVASAAYPLVRR